MAYEDIIAEASKTYGVPEAMIAKIIQVESGGNPKAVSSAGATGIMQLMEATADEMGVTDREDPKQNIMGGTKYFRQLLDKYHGDEQLAAMAYNAGPGRVDNFLSGGEPLPLETVKYARALFGDLDMGYQNARQQAPKQESKSPYQMLVEGVMEMEKGSLPSVPSFDDSPAPEPPTISKKPKASPTSFLAHDLSGFSGGLSFRTSTGETQIAYPETAEEYSKLQGFSKYTESERGQ
ncbi:MAG: transglycosylase SLT domain-containing protein, partial [Deltaproteobacteria bacterium]|nr:transglycosylase SLT domain-containing protein [Deltaproteobacteria bacterium]